MSDAPLALTPAQASTLPSPLRNSIYAHLLSSGGIRTIEATLTQLLQTTGFQASLRAYMTDLFRTGQATSAPEAYELAMRRIRVCMAEAEENGGENGDDAGWDLKLPDKVIKEGGRVVRRELERVVEIDVE